MDPIHLLQHCKIPGSLLLVDIYKALEYLQYVLEGWDFGESILQWNSALYSSPLASVTHDGNLSATLPIFHGTRQGCPLSRLFILALEPLVIVVRDDPNISEIPYASTNHKVSLFADDALLTPTNPLTTLPNLQALLSRFSAFSGLHINPHKTTP